MAEMALSFEEGVGVGVQLALQ